MMKVRQPASFVYASYNNLRSGGSLTYKNAFEGPKMSLRSMSSDTADKAAPLFDDKMTQIYKHFAPQHHHKDGPFLKIVGHMKSYTAHIDAPIILDMASGPGEPAATIAKSIPTSTVYSTDISEAMHAIAKLTAANIPNMHAEVADMENLLQFQDNHVHAVSCCYGFMFPENKEKAIQETFRVLKPGGTLVATTWNHLPNLNLINEIMERVMGGPPPPPSINPLSLAEPGLFESLVETAGFQNIQVSTSQYPMHLSSDPECQFDAVLMFKRAKLEAVENGLEKAREAFDDLAEKHMHIGEKGNKVAVDCIYKCVVATKPNN
jgi:SAM-dependent methyltransferase